MDIIKQIEREQMRTDIPAFKSGDTVKVHLRIVEGEKDAEQFTGRGEDGTMLTGDVIDKDLFLISEKLQKLAPEQLRLVEDLIDACTDYFKGASGKD